jgi:antitoxin (DNA-binding transcriptional repressor) of toxin-antitoxin stability system
MADNAAHIPQPRLELSLVEARTRFVQLVRLAGLAQQTTVVTDGGRPLAAIVPVGGGNDHDGEKPNAAAGWVKRIETLRDDFQRQHAVLERALEQAWQELDKLRPPGVDRDVDELRVAHSVFRARR